MIFEDLKLHKRGSSSLDALKSLTKLLVHEIDSLAEITTAQPPNPQSRGMDLNDSVQRYEISLICDALVQCNGNQAKAAKKLGIKSTTLHAKIRRHGIDSMMMFGRFAQDEHRPGPTPLNE